MDLKQLKSIGGPTELFTIILITEHLGLSFTIGLIKTSVHTLLTFCFLEPAVVKSAVLQILTVFLTHVSLSSQWFGFALSKGID